MSTERPKDAPVRPEDRIRKPDEQDHTGKDQPHQPQKQPPEVLTANKLAAAAMHQRDDDMPDKLGERVTGAGRSGGLRHVYYRYDKTSPPPVTKGAECFHHVLRSSMEVKLDGRLVTLRAGTHVWEVVIGPGGSPRRQLEEDSAPAQAFGGDDDGKP